jgi:hypothetical protein
MQPTRIALLLLPLCSAVAVAAPPMAPPRPPRRGIAVAISIHAGAAVRRHVLRVLDHDCGRITDTTSGSVDELKLCVDEVELGGQIPLRLEWTTRTGTGEYSNRASVVVGAGGTFDVGLAGGPTLTAKVDY